MKYKLIIVRYGEIALKGKVTRRHFENILVDNIKLALKKNDIKNEIVKEWGRIFVYTSQINKSLNILKKIFGIISISPAIETKGEIKSISKLAVNLSKEKLPKKKTFALRVTRTGAHNFTSQDVAVKVGSDIVKATKSIVNLTKPDHEIFIEVRNKKAFLFIEKIRAVGGMPFRSQGKILAIIDNKNSILAAWYLIRRGCNIIFILNNEKERKNLEIFSKNWNIKPEIITIKKGKNYYKKINKIIIEKECDAVVTGQNIFRNSKKIFSELTILKKQINVPVLHPLISMDKKQINKKYKEIMEN